MPSPNADNPGVELTGIVFRWQRREKPVLEIPALSVGRGEHVFVHGRSGAGKTTLLSLLGGILVPEAGRVVINGIDLARLPSAKRDRFRADHIGLLFQLFNLVPYLSPVENVLLPCRFSVGRRRKAEERHGSVQKASHHLLDHMGLDPDRLATRSVATLSVGQQQRVAAARALIGEPALIIADEPTSALDADRRRNFLDLLFREAATAGATIVFVSHDTDLGDLFHRTLALDAINRAAATGER